MEFQFSVLYGLVQKWALVVSFFCGYELMWTVGVEGVFAEHLHLKELEIGFCEYCSFWMCFWLCFRFLEGSDSGLFKVVGPIPDRISGLHT